MSARCGRRILGALLAGLVGATVVLARSGADEPGILVSRQLAEAVGLAAGDVVELAGGAGVASRRFRIAAIYEPMPDPLRFTAPRLEARLHLPDLIDLTADPGDPLAAESVDAINVSLREGTDPDAFARALAAQVPGTIAVPTGATDGAGVFLVLERFHRAIAIVTVGASTVFLLTLMIMLVEERREVAGILRLIGVARRRIVLQVLAEGAAVAVAGTAVGLLLAWLSQEPINRFFQWRYDTSLVFLRITPGILLQTALVAVPLGTLACIAASWTALRQGALTLARR